MRFFAVLLLNVFTIGTVAGQETIFLNQGWNDFQREEFYFTDQGSQLIPFKWFLHLEQISSTELFRSNDNMRKYGILTVEPSKLNPHGLPIGFVRDGADSKAQNVGLEAVVGAEPTLEAKLETVQQEIVRKATSSFDIKKRYLGAGEPTSRVCRRGATDHPTDSCWNPSWACSRRRSRRYPRRAG